MKQIIRSILVVGAVLMLASPAYGQDAEQDAEQDALQLEALKIRLWPEFDNEDLLVILIGQAAGDRQPKTLSFTLPSNAEVHAVAEIVDVVVVNADYEQNGNVLNVATQNGYFQLEYYLPVIETPSDDTRSYVYEYQLDYPVENLVWEVQQPPGTGSLNIQPETNAVSVDEFGLPAYLLANQTVDAGEVISVSVSYRRNISQLTVDYLQAQGDDAHSSIDFTDAEEVSTDAAPRERVGRWLFYVGLIGVIITLMFIVALSYLRKGNQLTRAQGRAVESGAQRFCTNCGALLEEGNQFCTECGTLVSS